MSGKHEPPTNRSFYLSVATSTLRAVIILFAVVFGGVVLANAFPSADAPVAEDREEGAGGTATTPTTPPATPPETDAPTPPPVEVEGAVLSVLNGTSTTGLAGAWAQRLQQEGAVVPQENIGNHEALETTTLVHRPNQKPLAELLRNRFFEGAQLRAAEANDLQEGVQVQIILGADHAEFPD